MSDKPNSISGEEKTEMDWRLEELMAASFNLGHQTAIVQARGVRGTAQDRSTDVERRSEKSALAKVKALLAGEHVDV